MVLILALFTPITLKKKAGPLSGKVSVMAKKCLLLPMFDSTLPPLAMT